MIDRMRMIFDTAIKIYVASRGIKRNILAEMSFKEVIIWTESLMEDWDNEELLNISIRMALIEFRGAII